MINLILIKTAIFILPGIIGFKIYKAITCQKNRFDNEDFINIAIYSFFVFFFYDLVSSFCSNGKDFEFTTKSLNSLVDDSLIVLSFPQILLTLLIAVLFAYILAFITSRNIIYKVSFHTKINKNKSGENVWNTYHNDFAEWVVVRDFKNKAMYYGYIRNFSFDNDTTYDLILYEVDASELNGKKKRKIEIVYLSLEKGSFTIEIPNILFKEEVF